VDRFIKCSHKVTEVRWDADKSKWYAALRFFGSTNSPSRRVTVENVSTGEVVVDEADVLISARGTLNNIAWPEIPGLSEMKIPVMHSAAWDDR
jgi:cation diffusion facilitator CzcD-associated flavoprotein CzcO